MVHTTIGVYNGGDFKMNGVLPEHLEAHIEYNKTWRFGRALFVDGKCVYKGYLDDERVKAFEQRIIKDNLVLNKCTVPYQ